jgi:D-alanyl-D-alanine carboxypeptidase (penicillin-binding protein 5/6)
VKRYTYLKIRKCFASVLLGFVVLISTCYELNIAANPFYVGEVLKQSGIKGSDLKKEKVSIKEGELYARGAVLMDAATGRVLYGKNPELQLAMASTTKIMTCIVALECADFEEVVTASAHAAAQPKVKLYLNKGEQVRLKDLLYSLMLESHNDSATAIAEHIGAEILGWPVDKESVMGRTEAESKEAVQAFIAKMNEKARELQCYDTWFITPNGLDGTEYFYSEEGVEEERFHSTTATELARIMSYCILQSPKRKEFLEITGTYSHDFTNIEKTRSFICNNHNAFLNMMEGAISGKTGYTGRAGYCYVGALKRDERYFVVALLDTGAYGSGNKGNKWKDTHKLMNYGLEHFSSKIIYEGNTETLPVLVENAKRMPDSYFEEFWVETGVLGESSVSMLLADWEKVDVSVQQENKLTAPVRKGQVVGKIEITLEGELLKHFDIVCVEHVEKKSFKDSLLYVWYLFLIH